MRLDLGYIHSWGVYIVFSVLAIATEAPTLSTKQNCLNSVH